MDSDLIDVGIDNGLRQWCDKCGRFTRSITLTVAADQCAEHVDELDDEYDWIDDEEED